MSLRLIMPTWPPMPGISIGILGVSATSISTSACRHLVGLDALTEALEAGGLARFLADQRVEQPLHRRIRRRSADGLAPTVPLQPHRFLDQIAHDLLDIAADIADLGELGRLDLDEGRVGQLRQAAADLGLADAGRADHQDVLGRHLVAQLAR
jgi:hypothetical protein